MDIYTHVECGDMTSLALKLGNYVCDGINQNSTAGVGVTGAGESSQR